MAVVVAVVAAVVAAVAVVVSSLGGRLCLSVECDVESLCCATNVVPKRTMAELKDELNDGDGYDLQERVISFLASPSADEQKAQYEGSLAARAVMGKLTEDDYLIMGRSIRNNWGLFWPEQENIALRTLISKSEVPYDWEGIAAELSKSTGYKRSAMAVWYQYNIRLKQHIGEDDLKHLYGEGKEGVWV